MEQKAKGIGREKISQWWHLQLWNSELTRVSLVCPFKGFSCGTQQSSVVWYILNMHLWCGARVPCSLQTSVELARSQHGLCCNQYVVRKGLWITSQSKEDENIAGCSAMRLKKWLGRGLLALLPENVFRSLFDPCYCTTIRQKQGGKLLVILTTGGTGPSFLWYNPYYINLENYKCRFLIIFYIFIHRVELHKITRKIFLWGELLYIVYPPFWWQWKSKCANFSW